MSDTYYPQHQRIAPARHLARGEVAPLPALPVPSPVRADASVRTGLRLVIGRRRPLAPLLVAALLSVSR